MSRSLEDPLEELREESPEERVSSARALRDQWLSHGTSTDPADRPAAEAAVTELYRLAGAPPPRFVWAPSPVAALRALSEDRQAFRRPPVRARSAPATGAGWHIADRLATLMSDLRDWLDRRTGHRPRTWHQPPHLLRGERWPSVEEAVDAGFTPRAAVWSVVGEALGATVRGGIVAPMRAALLPAAPDPPPPLTWYGQHDAYWVAYYDVHARLGLVRYRDSDARQLALWARLARSTGWWWPGEGRCVMAERPVELHTEPLPGGGGQLRLHRSDGPAVRFADGTRLFALRGTHVPPWVLTDPAVERIHTEPDVEVRRRAIERLGWGSYVEQAGLPLVATADDPGNGGARLRLYDVPPRVWGRAARLLLVVNGSPEPDGRRRRYGVMVPHGFDDPVAAAGWTYGLTGDQYPRLLRRT